MLYFNFEQLKDIIRDPAQIISDSSMELTIDSEWAVTLAGKSHWIPDQHNCISINKLFGQVKLVKLLSNRFPTEEILSVPAVHGTVLRVHVNTV